MTEHESVVLDFWNGRPSIWLSTNDGDPFLHWMIIGHNETYDLWMHARLSWAVADDMVSNPPVSIDDALTRMPGADAQFVMLNAGRPFLQLNWTVPNNPKLDEGLRLIVARLQKMARTTGADVHLKDVQSDVESLLVH